MNEAPPAPSGRNAAGGVIDYASVVVAGADLFDRANVRMAEHQQAIDTGPWLKDIHERILGRTQRSRVCVYKFDRPRLLTGHTAFDDPTSPPGAAPRESIESRTLVFF